MDIVEKKMLNAIAFFANKSLNNQINRLKLMKLLWLADRVHLNKYGRLILKDKYCALPNGPVPSKTKDLTHQKIDGTLSVIGAYIIKSEIEFDARYFSKSDIEIMEMVWEKYGQSDRFVLKEFSHKFPEWIRYEKDLSNPCSPNSYPILMDDLFNPPVGNVDYDYNQEESNHSKEIYQHHSAIQSSLS